MDFEATDGSLSPRGVTLLVDTLNAAQMAEQLSVLCTPSVPWAKRLCVLLTFVLVFPSPHTFVIRASSSMRYAQLVRRAFRHTHVKACNNRAIYICVLLSLFKFARMLHVANNAL